MAKNGTKSDGSQRFICQQCRNRGKQKTVDDELRKRKQVKDGREFRQTHDHLLQRIESLEKELTTLKAIPDVNSYEIPYVEATHRSESTAVTLWSDWHCEEEVKASTVNGLNSFNLDVCRQRIEHLANRVVKFIRMYRRDTDIKNIVIGLIGDFITGNIHEENMENCLLRPMEAIMLAEELIAGAIDFILAHTKINVTCVCVPGNHSRITDRIRFSTEMGNSLEYYMYHHLAKHYRGNVDMTFAISPSALCYCKIYGLNVRFLHGQQIRYSGGVGGLLIPARRKVSEWDKAIPADLNMIGHWHQEQKFGKIVTNGSLIGYNAFALAGGFEFEPPKQQFFLINGHKRAMSIYSPILF